MKRCFSILLFLGAANVPNAAPGWKRAI